MMVLLEQRETSVHRKAVAATLSVHAARCLHLAAQGLLNSPRRCATKQDVLAAIRRMQLLQIDTIHVVARSPYFTLWSRLGDYHSAWLDELLAETAIFETWAHEACFAPMEDWALLRRHLDTKSHHWALRHAQRMHREQRADMNQLLDHVRAHGAVRSADFARKDGGKSGGWWGWKDEKRWLEAWFALGELMVLRRENFQRVYALSERVLARAGVENPDACIAAVAEPRQVLIERSLRALGIARATWIADYFRLRPRVSDEEMQPLIADGSVVAVEVRGWSAPAYVHADLREMLDVAVAGRLRATRTTILSPFDPVIWDRDRALDMFDFEYRLECYVPEAKRRYGYFVLPILHRGRLVGRLDAKAHRREHIFEVKRIEFEAARIDESTLMAVAKAVTDCARWHGAERVSYARSSPQNVSAALQRMSVVCLNQKTKISGQKEPTGSRRETRREQEA